MRQPDSSVNLWVDQICINQDDLKEKGLQVDLMSKLYQRSWVTVVWLGEEADNSSEALESMHDFNAVFQYELDESAPDPDFFSKTRLPVPRSQQWQDLNSLLARPWFQRVWVIQEVISFSELPVYDKVIDENQTIFASPSHTVPSLPVSNSIWKC